MILVHKSRSNKLKNIQVQKKEVSHMSNSNAIFQAASPNNCWQRRLLGLFSGPLPFSEAIHPVFSRSQTHEFSTEKAAML